MRPLKSPIIRKVLGETILGKSPLFLIITLIVGKIRSKILDMEEANMKQMTQHEKWMKASEALSSLYDLFDNGLNEKECNDLGRSLRAIHQLMNRLSKVRPAEES